MIENDYPIPSYMADVFEKPDGWVETPQPAPQSILLLPHEKQRSRVYAIDCEMVRCRLSSTTPTHLETVLDRRWKGTDPGLHGRLPVWHRRIRQTRQTTQARH